MNVSKIAVPIMANLLGYAVEISNTMVKSAARGRETPASALPRVDPCLVGDCNASMIETGTAQLILIGITTCGAVVWFCAATYFLRAVRSAQPRPPETADRFEAEERPKDNTAWGALDVSGNAAELAEKLGAILSRGGLCGHLVRIESRTDRELVFDVLGPMGMQAGASAGGGASYRGAKRCWVRFQPVSSHETRVEYVLQIPPAIGLVIGGGVFVVVGLIVLVAGFVLSEIFAIPDARFRGQVVQMVQTVHFLWPPFLFGSLIKRMRSLLPVNLETMIQNLPHMVL
jgi:hypothetical protein